MSDLSSKKCVPCEYGSLPLNEEQVNVFLKQLKLPWEVIDSPRSAGGAGGKKIKHEFKFNSYMEGLDFAVKVGKIAESQDHHPNIHIYYERVVIDLITHNIGGLSENDFIVAAKIEELSPNR